VFAVVGGELRWQKIDGGCYGGDCSSSSLYKGSSLCFSLSLSILIALPYVTVFVSSPLSLCLLFLICFASVSLISLLYSPLFSFAALSFFLRFLSSIPFVLPHFLIFSFLFCFFVLAVSFFFWVQSPSFFFFLFLSSVSQSILPSISHPLYSFLFFLFSLYSTLFPLLFLSIFSPSFLLYLLVFIGKGRETHPVLSCHRAWLPYPIFIMVACEGRWLYQSYCK